MKIRKRILAAVLTAIMTISMLPANTFATETVGNEEAESAVEAVSVSTEEQDVETTVEDVSEDLTEETSIEPSETDEVEETADPAAEETIETVEETVESTEEAEAAEPAAAEPAAEPAVEEVEVADTVDWPVTLEAKGKDYVVAVTYDAEAGIPADAKVEVEEILANDKAYDEYVEQAADKIDADVENLSYVRLFDISLVGADGDKLEPTGPVDVKIRLKDVEKADETTQVVHFAGEKEIPEIIDTEIKGKDVFFETDGFSIYAVVAEGETGSEARLEVTLVLNNGEENIVILVKPDDITDGEFEKIVYDPGIPEAEGKKFMGWTTEQNYTDATTPMSFDEVREDIQDKLASVKEGDTATYYAMMFNAYELYYVNENNVLFNTVSLMSTANSVTADVTQEYSVTGSTDGFVGWVEQGTTKPVYEVGQQITITTAQPQVVLTPKLGPGKWLYFDGNDGGSTAADTASYTRPAFIPQDTPATAHEPADPTRRGYTFVGWYTEAEGGTKFNFGQTIDTDTTIYAHWIPDAEAEYTVIVWAQSVDDDKDAADAAKTYDYVNSQKFTVATGTQITEQMLADAGFLSYGNSDFGVTDLDNSTAFQYRTFEVENGAGAGEDEVSALGNTVVNVYYDRCLMTIQFSGASEGSSQTWYEEVVNPTASEVYALVDGEYVLLGRDVVERKAEWVEYNGTKVYNPTEIYKRNANSATSVDAIMSYSGNANILNSADGTVYERIGLNNIHTLYASSSSSYTQMYLDYNNKTRVVVRIKYVYGYTLNGEEYTGPFYEKKTGNAAIYTGLYGQSLSKYGYEWPDPDSTWWSIAYVGSFSGNLFGNGSLGGKQNKIETYKTNNTVNTTLIFYVQDPENESTYTRVATAGYRIPDGDGFNITERFTGAEPVSYAWSNSSAVPTSGWVAAGDGYTSAREGSYLHIRYDRVKNDIVFMLGSETEDTIEGVPFEKNLAPYESQAPAAPEVGENEYFYGWYEDPEGVTKVNWNENMPLGNKVIYGITAPVQYHVIIEMNADGDTVDFGGASQRTEFWLDYGETISGANLMRATRTNSEGDSYSIIGYYTENAAAGQFDNDKLWNFDARVTEQSLAVKYTGSDDPRRAEYGDDGWDNTVGVFKLYASWRDDSLIKSGGIHIRYDDGTEQFVDPYGYADMATVIVKEELNEANRPERKYFVGWKLGDVVYLPGQTFLAAKDAAVKESDGYYITLTAEYADIEEKTPTHIVWYMNDGTGAIYKTSPELGINEATDIPAAPSRGDGYRFLGWAKDEEKATAEGTPNTSTNKTEPDFLEYKNGSYYITGTNKQVAQVAADEILPYEALYAIWSPVCKVYHSSGDMETVDITKGGTIDLVSMVPGDKLYGGYYEYVEKGDHKGAAYEVSGRHVVPYKDTDTSYEGVTYFLKEVDPGYLKPQVYLVWNTKHNNLIVDLYGFVDIDVDEDYSDCGLMMVDPDDHKTINETISTEEDLASEAINVTKDGNPYASLTIDSLFGMSSGVVGMAYLSDYIEAEATLEIRGYYVTLDGITVTGFNDRMLQFGPGNGHNGMPTHKGWNVAGSTQSGLYTVGKAESKAASLTSSKPMTARRVLTVNAPSDNIGFTITKVYDSGTEDQIVEGGDCTGEIGFAARNGYMFAGWYLDEAFTTPADFADVKNDMTVYGKYISASDISLAFARKYTSGGKTAFNATVSVKGQDALQNVSMTVNENSAVILGSKTVKKSGSGKKVSYVTSYRGLVKVDGLAQNDTFTAVVSWITPDGTAVTGSAHTCTYTLKAVTVQ